VGTRSGQNHAKPVNNEVKSGEKSQKLRGKRVSSNSGTFGVQRGGGVMGNFWGSWGKVMGRKVNGSRHKKLYKRNKEKEGSHINPT